MKRNLLYIGLQALHLMVYCVIVNYAGTVLLGNGYTNSEIGVILALGNLFGFLLQFVAASVSDRMKKVTPSFVMAVCFAIVAVLILLMIWIDRHCIAYTILHILAIAFISMLIPLIYAYAEYLQKKNTVIHFSVARGGAAISFSIMSTIAGAIYSKNGAIPIYKISLMLLAAIFAILFMFSRDKEMIVVSEKIETGSGDAINIREFVTTYKPFCYYLLGAFIVFCGTTFLQNYMIQAVEYVGGSSGQMGIIFGFGALMESLIFFSYGKVRKKIRPKSIIEIALLFYTLQGIMLLFTKTPTMLFIAYFIQSPAAAFMVPAVTDYIAETLSFSYVNRGQALYNGIYLLSRIVSACVGGILLGSIGIPGMFVIQAITSAVGTAIVIKGFR